MPDDDRPQPYRGLIGQATSRTEIDPPVAEEYRGGFRTSEPSRGGVARTLFAVRYVVPGVLVVVGIVWAVVDWPEGAEAMSLFTGAGLAILLLNQLFRMGVSGDLERDAEEDARRYFDEHGHWPDERPSRGENGRTWSLPPNIATPESEEAERQRRRDG